MQWGQIKSLFIICFLILNIYLFIEFYGKQKQPEDLVDDKESSLEEQFDQDNIQVQPKLEENTEGEKESFITVEQKEFTDEEASDLKKADDQSRELIDQKLLVSLLDEPIKISTEGGEDKIAEKVQQVVPYMDEYMFWDWNRDLNVLIFFQEKNGRPIYYNQNGLVLVFLNEDNEMNFYSLSLLGEAESRPEEKRTLISSTKAIETLYETNELVNGDEVNEVDVGFHTRIPSTDGSQVFVPTWKVTKNDTKNYFVNAIEGYVFSSSESEFLEETLSVDLERVNSFLDDKKDEKVKSRIVDQYKEKLELLEQGGE